MSFAVVANCCGHTLVFALIAIALFSDVSCVQTITKSAESRAKWRSHQPLHLASDDQLSLVVRLGDTQRFNETLSHILVPRVVGTEGHRNVRQYIQKRLTDLGWHMETDSFEADTPAAGPHGRLTFENIIATLDPQAERYLVLACHYDSKHFVEFEFLGASDSAVPCAMLIDLAHSLGGLLANGKRSQIGGGLSLQLVFFDGEEAFVEWSDEDSLYGSKHLAERWEEEGNLERIDMLVLLDLLGMPDPQFYSFFRNTDAWHLQLYDIEQRLSALEMIERDAHSGVVPRLQSNAYFQQRSINSFIDDDHVPFLRREVPILHLIPVPFPDEWHKRDDDWRAVDLVTVENLSRVLRVFVIEYLNIEME